MCLRVGAIVHSVVRDNSVKLSNTETEEWRPNECGGYDSVSWLKMVSLSSQNRSNNKNQHALVDFKSQVIINFFCGFSAHVIEVAIGCGNKNWGCNSLAEISINRPNRLVAAFGQYQHFHSWSPLADEELRHTTTITRSHALCYPKMPNVLNE